MKNRRKSIFTLVFAVLLLFPALVLADYPVKKHPDVTPPVNMKPNGEYYVYVLKNGQWQEAGKLLFDEFFREREIEIDKYLSEEGKVRIQLVQKGGTAAHIDSVFLGEIPPAEVIGLENGLKKLSAKDLDVSDVFGKSIEVVFNGTTKYKVLKLAARIEGINRGIPFQFPLENLYRRIDKEASFYTYKLNSNKGDINIDGYIDKVYDQNPFFKEYSLTVTGHPSDYTYGWVRNDDRYLYVTLDFTPDNTMDGDKDFAKVYIRTKDGIKEYKLSVPETQWGVAGFSYTNKVAYQHKVYEFRIPLTEIGEDNSGGNDNISLAFSAYGTAGTGSVCGDGIVAGSEACDDGNTADNDGCSATCTVEPGYNCSGSPSVCTPICGDGAVTGSEACDDGNTNNSDGCSATCTVEPGYNCSGSPSVCTPICGDGAVTGSEACDDGNTNNSDGCSASCTVESGYNCSGSPSVCNPICGDGAVTGSEACDDGNTADNDGCSATCTVEPGYNCSGSPSVCNPICGDGAVTGSEACDDGNTNNSDGCSAACTVEPGYNCSGSPSVCNPICGDGAVTGSEACDDGNTNNSDGCSATCTVEAGYNCSGSPSVCTLDSDGDGVSDTVENAAPNNGDGNNDGTQDSVQSNVASLPSATGQGYITIVATGCGQLTNVYATTEASQPQQDEQYDYPFGLAAYTLTDCTAATVNIIFHGTTDLAGFVSRKFDNLNLWYGFGTISTNTLTLNLTDNAQGDSNPALGTITDPAGPAVRQGEIPAMTEWGIIIFIVLAGLGSVYYLRRQKKSQRC